MHTCRLPAVGWLSLQASREPWVSSQSIVIQQTVPALQWGARLTAGPQAY